MPDPFETYVRWYLRFNGYLCVENFVIHEPTAGVVPQGGEFDVVGMRSPYSRESPGLPIQLHEQLVDREAQDRALVDVVIGEVKSRHRRGLNPIWSHVGDTRRSVRRLAYLIRWLGLAEDDAQVERIADALHAQRRARTPTHLIRLVLFVREKHRAPQVPEITFREIAGFFAVIRAPCWGEAGLGVRSCHDQWDPMIKKMWDLATPDGIRPEEARVDDILQVLAASPRLDWPR